MTLVQETTKTHVITVYLCVVCVCVCIPINFIFLFLRKNLIIWLKQNKTQNGVSFAKSHITKVKVKIVQSCPTLCDPIDYTDHGIL